MTHDPSRASLGRLALPDGKLSRRFSRSSGAGGQHVNTFDTRVELIWSLADSAALSPAQKELATTRLAGRLVDGTITVLSSPYRSEEDSLLPATVRLLRALDWLTDRARLRDFRAFATSDDVYSVPIGN